jgi:transcriptional regulator
MYDIPYFKAADHQEVIDFMQANAFVTICGVNAVGKPVATHIPILIDIINDQVILSGHIMRKQDHTNAFELNKDVLVMFTAPSAYVSASWYTEKNMASTWNYQAVHANGSMHFKEETHLLELLDRLTKKFEKDPASPTQLKNLSADYVQQNCKAIVSFEIIVDNLQHVFKLSQNRDEISHKNIQDELSNGDAACKYMAGAMKR